MDGIQDILSAQSAKTASLGRYEGHGHVSPDRGVNRLKQLIAQLKNLLGQFPPEIAAMLSGVISDAEALCAAGGPVDSIGGMIAKIERILELLMQLLMELTGPSGQPDLTVLTAFLRGLAAQLDATKKAAIAKQLQNLRRAASQGSLKGIDDADFGDLSDGSQAVEPIADNVIDSLQGLIKMALDYKRSAATGIQPAK